MYIVLTIIIAIGIIIYFLFYEEDSGDYLIKVLFGGIIRAIFMASITALPVTFFLFSGVKILEPFIGGILPNFNGIFLVLIGVAGVALVIFLMSIKVIRYLVGFIFFIVIMIGIGAVVQIQEDSKVIENNIDEDNTHWVTPHMVDGYETKNGVKVDPYYRDGDGNTDINRTLEQGGGYRRGNPDGDPTNNLNP